MGVIRERGAVLSLVVLVWAAGGGCPCGAQGGAAWDIGSVPDDAEFLFLTNRDSARRLTGRYRKEIYAAARSWARPVRITRSKAHHYLVGADSSRRYIVTSCADRDTSRPRGLGDEDLRNVWVIDLERRTCRRVTPRANLAEGDSFSPDGEWIVFFMVPKGEHLGDIYKVRRDGARLTNLTNTPGISEADPVWSHDGSCIAYLALRTQPLRFVLRAMGADGGSQRDIHDPGGGSVATESFPAGCYDPSWSPDDERIVFSQPVAGGGHNGRAGIWHVCTTRSDGTGFRDLSKAGGHTTWAEYIPRFAAAGDLVLFSARYGPTDPAKVKVDVFTMALDGAIRRNLTSSRWVDDGAFWLSPPRTSASSRGSSKDGSSPLPPRVAPGR